MSDGQPQPVEVSGVVYPPGPGGGREGSEARWTLGFSLQPWRAPDGHLEERELRVSEPNLTDQALRERMASIDAYAVLRFRLLLEAPEPGAGSSSGELIEYLGREEADGELKERAAALQEPVTVEAPFFGTLTLNRSLNWYEKEVEWNSRPVQLYLPRDECQDEAALFRAAATLWDQQEAWEQRVRDYAVEELLELKNDTWLADDEEEFTADEFKARMSPESIVVFPDGGFDFTYDDGGLFWGHVIQVSGSLDDGPTDAGIAG